MKVTVPREVIFDILHDATKSEGWEDRLNDLSEAWEKLNDAYDEGQPDRVIDQLANDIYDAEKAIAEHLFTYFVDVPDEPEPIPPVLDHPLIGKWVRDRSGHEWHADRLIWVDDQDPNQGQLLEVHDTAERIQSFPLGHPFTVVGGD